MSASSTAFDQSPETASALDEATVLEVMLCDGSTVDLTPLDDDQLCRLQWEQEQAFAARIRTSRKGSPERAEAFRQGYDTVLTILRRAIDPHGQSFVMGLDPRYRQLVLDLLARQTARLRRPPRFFEVGYAAGVLLEAVHAAGADVAGIEVSDVMRREACQRLPTDVHGRLFLGDLLTHALDGTEGSYDLVYWNDVFEHIAPDEILEFLVRIRRLLAPGGQLISVTPNWHMRPSDITATFCPPRTEARGFHLKEYTLRETTTLLRRAGFNEVATPLLVTHRRVYLAGQGLAGCKRAFEPCLEWLPFRLARMGCIGLGLGCTIART